MKTIPYIKKTTTAHTEYRKISDADRKWVLDQCQAIKDFVDTAKNMTDPSIRAIVNDLTKADKGMPWRSPKHGGGANNPYSMSDGTLDNFKSGQYDLSDKTCKGLEKAFATASKHLNNIEDVVFNETTSLPVVPKATTPKVESVGTTFTQLFDIEISVKVTPKKG